MTDPVRVCGTGGWAGPLPGDPSAPSGLSAVGKYGWIELSWNLPGINPHAVSSTTIYRSSGSSFPLSQALVTVGGNSYVDPHDDDDLGVYYYWVRSVSINGTPGELVGPVSAAALPSIDKVLTGLSNKIDSGFLATSLRAEIDRIALLDTNLASEALTRLNENQALTAALALVHTDVAAARTLILNETTTRQQGQDALITSLNALATGVGDNAAAIVAEQSVRTTAVSALAQQVTAMQSTVAGNTAAITAEQVARSSAIESLAQDITELVAAAGVAQETSAALLQEATVRAAADSSLSQQITTLESQTTSNIAAAVQTLQQAQTTATSAQADINTTVQASIGAKGKVIYGSTAPIVADRLTQNLWIDTTGGANTPKRWNGSAWVAMTDKVASDAATASTTNAAAITNETTARVAADNALSTQITTAQSTLNGNIAAAQTTLQTNINTVNGKVTSIGALYSAKVNVNGLIGGFGVYNDGTSVEAGFDVNTFWIGSSSSNKRKPFMVTGGVVYIDSAVISTITAGQIDTRGLTIRAADGTLLFGAGTPLAAANITPSNSWLNANVSIAADGTLSGAGGGKVSITGLGYMGALDATKNVVTTGTTAPTTPTNGDTWVDTSGTVPITKVRIANSWVQAGNLTTNTSQLVDGAGLGTKANWANVTGAAVVNAAIVAAQTAADTAQDTADAANNALTNLASDNILSPSEKPMVVQDYTVITSEQAGIDAQATAYGVTTEKTTYDTAVTALTTYLNGLTGWNTVPGSDVVIVGSTFRSKFSTVYTARQALLNKIASLAKGLADAAQTAANTGIANAATAKTTADAAVASASAAQTSANAANTALTNLADDNILSPSEKPLVIRDYAVITEERMGIGTQAIAYGISTERTAYGTAIDALTTYLNGLTGWNTLPGSNVTIVGATFRQKFADVYAAKQILLNKISEVAKALADAAQTTANTGVTNAATAQTTANTAVTNAATAQTAANTANNLLVDISNDAKLTPVEKQAVRREWDTVVSEKAGINTQATAMAVSAVTTANTAYNTAFQALGTYLNAGTAYTISTSTPPSWLTDANLGTTTTIVGSTFRSTWKAMFDARQALLNAVATAASQMATWASVGGAGKPEDYATAGATWGVDIGGSNLPANNAGKVIDGGNGTATYGQRGRNDLPSEYPVGNHRQFKLMTAIGLTATGNGYCTLETIKGYPDTTGVAPVQYAYDSAGATWKRNANSGWTAWLAWVQDLDRTNYTGDLDATKGARAGTNLLDSTGATIGDAQVLNSLVGGVNLVYGLPEESSVPAGTYGVALFTLKSASSNIHSLQPGEKLTLSAELWCNAAAIGASQESRLYLWTSDAQGAWKHSVTIESLTATPYARFVTVTLPAAAADMVNVVIGLYHNGGETTATGVVYARKIQVERGSVATLYAPGSNPAATKGAPAGTQVNGVAVEDITAAIVDYNAGNNRNATAVVAPTIASDGTAIDHLLLADGSANISFEWSWGGTAGDIDGFLIYAYGSGASGAYTFGTAPGNEQVFIVPAEKRAFFMLGASATLYWTFGIAAYRKVDKDINSTGVIKSTIVKSTATGEATGYRPTAAIAFTGDITGTINGTLSTANVNAWSAITGSTKPADNATAGATWGVDIADTPYSQIYNNDDSVALGFNPTFDWPSGTTPTGWSIESGTAPTKETSNVRIGTSSVRYTATGVNQFMQHLVSFSTTPLPVGTFLSGSVDMYLDAVTSGLPGVLVRLYTNSALSTYVDAKVQPPTATLDVWQRVPWVARVAAGQQIYGIRIYVMGAWTVFASGAFTGTVIFDNLRFMLADQSLDNKTITLAADGALSGAGGGAVTIAGLGYTGALNATNNVVTASASAPASPTNGDIWVDTNAPVTIKTRVSGAWVAGGAVVTSLSQVNATEGTKLSGVAAGATKNIITSGLLSARPTGADGDFYFATDTSVLYQKISGSWVAGATNNTVSSGTTAPASPSNGDIWIDTNSPVTIKTRVGNAWVAGGAVVTSLSQVNATEGTKLSGIATGATANIVSSGLLSARPTGADGDFYYATDTYELFQKVSGAWVLASTNGADVGSDLRDSNGNVLTDGLVKNNLVDSSYWAHNTNGWSQYSATGTNLIVTSTNPKGQFSQNWKVAAAVGQLSWQGGYVSPRVKTQANRIYRVVIPVRRLSGTAADGSIYLGVCQDATPAVCAVGTTTTDSNPYFFSTTCVSMVADEWYYVVGYLYASGTNGTLTSAGAGLYRASTGALAWAAGTSFSLNSASTSFALRTGLYKSSAFTVAQAIEFAPCFVHVMDGTEPSVRELMSNTAVLNSAVTLTESAGVIGINPNGGGGATVTTVTSNNKITSTNVSIYMASAAIQTAYIADLAVNAAKIADATVTTAKIANAAITTAKIDDLQVSTLKIANNAVTVPVLTQSTSIVEGNLSPTGSTSSGSFTAISSSFTASGAPVKADFIFQYGYSTVGTAFYASSIVCGGTVELLIDGVSVASYPLATEALTAGAVSEWRYTSIPWYVWTPASGSHTIALRFNYFRTTTTPTNGQLKGRVQQVGILTTETLK